MEDRLKQRKKKRTTDSNNSTSPGLPVVVCERLNCKLPMFSWKIGNLTGTVEERKNALMEKLMEFEGDERKKAAVSLLDFPGDNSLVSAAIMVIKEVNVNLSLGVLASKAFKGRSYGECMQILEKAGISQLDDEVKERIRRLCEDRGMDNDLFGINI